MPPYVFNLCKYINSLYSSQYFNLMVKNYDLKHETNNPWNCLKNAKTSPGDEVFVGPDGLEPPTL